MLNIMKPYQRQLMDAERQAYVQDLMNKERAHMEDYLLYREYYDGRQKTQVTERVRQFLNIQADADFTVNYCPIVVNAKADRLKVKGFETEDKQSEIFWDWWRKSRMDKQSGQVHRGAIRDADSFVLVEWDNVTKTPRFYHEPAYAGDGIMVYYSEERRNEIKFASKQWRCNHGMNAGKERRLNLYFSDRIEKYISKDDIAYGRYLPYEDEETTVERGHLGLCGMVRWVDRMGLPLGIPVVHFKNDDDGDGFGRSQLANVIPLQDVLNKTMIDLIATMDVEGFALLVGYGMDWSSAKVGPGAIVSSSKSPQEAKLERLLGTNPVGMLAAYSAIVMEIARVSGTPLSYFQTSGQVAAEGTMKQQEITLISQVEKTQTDFGNSWEDVMTIARRLYNTFGQGGMKEDVLIDTLWEKAESRNAKEETEIAVMKVEKLQIPASQVQLELGYEAKDVARFERLKLKADALAIKQQAQLAAQNPQANNLNQTENKGTEDAAANQ
jgi:hypothetical protein